MVGSDLAETIGDTENNGYWDWLGPHSQMARFVGSGKLAREPPLIQ